MANARPANHLMFTPIVLCILLLASAIPVQAAPNDVECYESCQAKADDETQAQPTSDPANGDDAYLCVIRDFVCFCTATTEYNCPDITGDEECGASVGPSRGIQVGLLCPIINDRAAQQEANAAPGNCLQPNLVCYCYDSMDFQCRESFFGQNCTATVGLTPRTQFGFICLAPGNRT